MAAISKLTNDTLRQYLNNGFTQQEIANLCGVSQPAIAKRVRCMDQKGNALTPQPISRAVVQMWDTRAAAESNYIRALGLYEEALADPECSIGEKARVLAEIRNHIDFGLRALQALYEINEMKAFQDEVTSVLEECSPGLRAKILKRLSERRTLRAAIRPV
jgi:hypothetical protein